MKAPNCFISAWCINNSYGFMELPLCGRIQSVWKLLLQWMVVGVPSPTLQEAGIHALVSAAVAT